MHARIENEGNKILKGGPIFEPSQWVPMCNNNKKMADHTL